MVKRAPTCALRHVVWGREAQTKRQALVVEHSYSYSNTSTRSLPLLSLSTRAASAVIDVMVANTKYTPAPQRDSFEEAGYSQAPPSYQAEPLIHEARGEDDNLPDDFKVRTADGHDMSGDTQD